MHLWLGLRRGGCIGRGLIHTRNTHRTTSRLINLNEGAAQAYFAAGYRKG